ncbi:hypothetical protein AEQU3_02524 [Aequorivita antarctica]|nr:hypothetical protein AEQU3_02524 [Aequorivita antarctica]
MNNTFLLPVAASQQVTGKSSTVNALPIRM